MVEKALKSSQKAASALRRAVHDMRKMRTALTKLRVSLKNKKKVGDEDERNKIAKGLAGRTSIAKNVNMTDPVVILKCEAAGDEAGMMKCMFIVQARALTCKAFSVTTWEELRALLESHEQPVKEAGGDIRLVSWFWCWVLLVVSCSYCVAMTLNNSDCDCDSTLLFFFIKYYTDLLQIH